MEPLVSVIIPVYNVRPYLSECIDSVIEQTYRNLEIIIIDDGSTDGSGRICDMYKKKDPRIRVIHQENCGLSAARNAGLDVMTGEIVSFLDSDDAFLPNMIEVMVGNMLRSGADIVCCGKYICKTNKHMSTVNDPIINPLKDEILTSEKSLLYLIERKIDVTAWDKIYKRHLFDNMRFPKGHVYEDLLTMPYIFEKADKVITISDCLIRYRKRSDSITASFTANNSMDWLYARKREREFVLYHSPSVFNSEQLKNLKDFLFRSLIICYFTIQFDHLRKRPTSKKVRAAYEKEIRKNAKDISDFSFKTKIIYALYNINQYFCHLLFYGYGFIKKRLHKLLEILLRRDHG